MDSKYFAGKWNEHDIVFINEEAEQLVIDGKPVAKNKPGMHLLYTGIEGEIPIEPELHAVIRYSDYHCACMVGKPLETSYDKETKTFYTYYKNHKIECHNKKMKGTLLVDGVEVDKEDGMFNTLAILGTNADENGKRIMAVLEPDGLKIKCMFLAEAENVKMYACKKQGGELVTVDQVGDGDFILGFMLGSMLN